MSEIKLLELTAEIKLKKTKDKKNKEKKKKILVKMGLNPLWALDPKFYEHH